MKIEHAPAEPNSNLTRRDALMRAVHGAVTAAVAAPAIVQAAPAASPKPEPAFVPENDYPFFGGEVPEGY